MQEVGINLGTPPIARGPEGIRARTERMFDFLPDIATDGALD